MIENPENIRRKTFRQLVGLFFLSLVYDIFWFAFGEQNDVNASSWGTKLAAYVEYIGFFVNVSYDFLLTSLQVILCLVLWKDST
jgi:uncharacterized membrane protein